MWLESKPPRLKGDQLEGSVSVDEVMELRSLPTYEWQLIEGGVRGRLR